MGKKKKKNKRKKNKTWKQMMDYLNDQALRIKQISREVFMQADTSTRKHSDKKKYTRKKKHKKNFSHDLD
mgnify:FL=1